MSYKPDEEIVTRTNGKSFKPIDSLQMGWRAKTGKAFESRRDSSACVERLTIENNHNLSKWQRNGGAVKLTLCVCP
eukprot:m.23891 g.23891  ORF g.23891 m.23891 type:complete len:76 (+) comp28547_c0_seq1:557-784(+)